MNNSRFVVREGHFHIADKESYVLTGWFEGAGMPQEEPAGSLFEAFADRERLRISVLCFQDEAARQKYAKYDMEVAAEYVIIAKLPPSLSRYRRLMLRLADGRLVYERRMSQLRGS